jgi:mannose-6-phosphate isomerase-like protein (cupin superfamily)
MKERFHTKKWGSELWFTNNPLYCGKKITILKGNVSSNGAFHHHQKKDETFFVLDGQLVIEYVENGEFFSITLHPEQSFRIKPCMKHRFYTISPECNFIEVSTTHSDNDSYRTIYEDGKWESVNPNKK